ncbi:MAG: hypothetical protein ABIJ09_01250 [Pseudomonadota bacterium]
MRHRILLVVLAAVLALPMVGCMLFPTGSANTEGQVGGREVSLGATVFSWWDTTVYDVDDDGNLFKQTRDGEDQVLHLRMYGYGFNPREDQRFWSWQQIIEHSYQISLHDRLAFQVGEAGSLSNSARLEYNNEDPPPSGEGPYLRAQPSFTTAPIKVNEGNDYPSTVKYLGSRRVFVLELKKVEREAGRAVEGSFEVKIEKSDADNSGTVVTGSVRGDFSAPVINERIAECNFDTGGAGMGVDPCDDLELDGENP